MSKKRGGIAALGLAIFLALVIGMGIVPAPQVVQSAGSVGVKINPQEVHPGDTFLLDIYATISAGEQVDGAEIYLDFDTTYLEAQAVPDPNTGNPVKGSTWFEMELANAIDNVAGEIDYAGGTFAGPFPNSDFIVATVKFKVKDIDPANLPLTTNVVFAFKPLEMRDTIVAWGGVGFALTPIVDGILTATPPLQRIDVTPSPAMVKAGGSQLFTATGYDALTDGNVVPDMDFTWSVTDATAGSIVVDPADSSKATFTAGTVTGVYANAIKATALTVDGYADVTVFQAEFDADRKSGVEPLWVTFIDKSAPHGSIDNWTWSFGDGATFSMTPDTYRERIRHKYTRPGRYAVSLKAEANTSEDIKEPGRGLAPQQQGLRKEV